jgi:hypothetical protein
MQRKRSDEAPQAEAATLPPPAQGDAPDERGTERRKVFRVVP